VTAVPAMRVYKEGSSSQWPTTAVIPMDSVDRGPFFRGLTSRPKLRFASRSERSGLLGPGTAGPFLRSG
jgi:hypothetical protein